MAGDKKNLEATRAKDRRFVTGVLAGALFLVPVMFVCAYAFFGFFFMSADTGMDRESPMEHAQPLTDAERELVRATHFDMTVAVVDPNGDPARTNSLIRDLAGTRLFDDVVASHDASDTDLVVTVARSSIDRGGARSFTVLST